VDVNRYYGKVLIGALTGAGAHARKRADPEAAQVSWIMNKGFQDKCKFKNQKKRGWELDRKSGGAGIWLGGLKRLNLVD
jgi:hypothetical protein